MTAYCGRGSWRVGGNYGDYGHQRFCSTRMMVALVIFYIKISDKRQLIEIPIIIGIFMIIIFKANLSFFALNGGLTTRQKWANS